MNKGLRASKLKSPREADLTVFSSFIKELPFPGVALVVFQKYAHFAPNTLHFTEFVAKHDCGI